MKVCTATCMQLYQRVSHSSFSCLIGSWSSVSSVLGVWRWSTTPWAESTERYQEFINSWRYKWSNTMEGSHDRSSSCSQLVSARKQRQRLLPLFSASATTFHNPLSLKQHQEPGQDATALSAHCRLTWHNYFRFCNLIGAYCTVPTDMAMHYLLPVPFSVFSTGYETSLLTLAPQSLQL